MNDYRALTLEQQRAVMESAAASSSPRGEEITDPLVGWARGPLPPDRKGLISATHPQCLRTEAEVVAWNALARETAMRTKQRVYTVMTNTRWHLMLFGYEQHRGFGGLMIWYDENENGDYADDQYIAHYEPDGSWKLDGVS